MPGNLPHKASARRILIVGNHGGAGQHSQRLYASFIAEMAQMAFGVDAVESWSQRGFFTQLPWPGPLKKVALDLDRYVLAPLQCLRLSADVLFIADNSNAWYARFIHRKSTIVGCHDMLAYVAAKGRVGGWRPSLATRLFMHANITAMRDADFVVSVSEVTSEVLREIGVDHVRVIHHCQLQDFPPAEPVPEVDEDILPMTFLHVGAGKFAKNSALVLAAFDQLCDRCDARLLLVGGGTERLKATSRHPERVFAMRSLRAGQLRHVYERCAALIMPSRYEGFGLPIIEAQALGCPAISSDGGALNEVMFEGPLKLRQPIAPENLASTMQRIVADAPFRRQMIEDGYRNAGRFDRQDTASGYASLFREIASSDHRSL